MNPHSRMIYALGSALLLWIPAAYRVLTGSLELYKAGLFFLAALIFAWIGTGFISSILENYQRQARVILQAKEQIAVIERRAEMYQRRKEDEERRDAQTASDDLPPTV